jgi:peptidyl-prolyl cis-trans isomerase SurA
LAVSVLPKPRRRAALRLVLALTLALAAEHAAAQGSVERIAAVVNNDVITTQDLNERLGLVAAASGLPSDPEIRNRLMQQVLRGYIDEKLQLQEAARLNLSVTDEDVDKALQTLAQRNHLDVDSFKRALEERKIEVSALRAQLKGQIAWAKVVGKEVRPRVAVTQDQVDLALKDALSGKADEQLALSEILLPVDSPDQQAQVLRDAQGLVATLRNGADFAALARQVSVASSAQAGGDLGWVRPSLILPELRDRLEQMTPGSVSDPIPSPVGVHIFKLRERRRGDEPPPPPKRFVPTRVSLAQVVLPLPPTAKDPDIKAAEKRAVGLAPSLKSCQAIDAYAKKSGAEGAGSLGWLAVKDLPPLLQRVVTVTEPGQLSPPIRGPLGVQMLMVCDRQGREETLPAPPAPPPPPAPTASDVRQKLEDEQMQRLATRYLRELRKDAFIDVRMGA